MAFDSAELSVLAYANGFTLWHYRTADRPADLIPAHPGNGYFAAANKLLRPGDDVGRNFEGKFVSGMFDDSLQDPPPAQWKIGRSAHSGSRNFGWI